MGAGHLWGSGQAKFGHNPRYGKLEMHNYKNNTFLICRPRGGFNDILCQIQNCIEYCKNFDRILIIDTRKTYINEEFSKYFLIKDIYDFEIITNTNQVDWAYIESLSTCSDIRSDTYTNKFSKNRIRLDFSKNYEENVIVHRSGGGGRQSEKLISNLKFTSLLVSDLIDNIKKLPRKYCAIHIRNTDHKSNYRYYLNKYDLKDYHDVLVCSDDIVSAEYLKDLYPNKNIFLSSKKEYSSGAPLHRKGETLSEKENYIIFRDSMIDLIALSLTDKLFAVPLRNRRKSFRKSPVKMIKYYFGYDEFMKSKYSGFSNLALFLNRNKNIITQLIQNEIRL